MKALALSAAAAFLLAPVPGHAVSAEEDITAPLETPAPEPAPISAKIDKDTQVMTYEVYAGGINAVQAELGLSYRPENYRFALRAATKGFLRNLAPWSGTFETNGWRLGGGNETPEMHKSTAIWRDEEEIKEYLYNKDGTFKKFTVTEEGEDKTPEDLDPSLMENTTDALTATLKVMQHIADGGKCEGSSEVFDGDRRFVLNFKHQAEEMLEPTDYNIYEGETSRCEVEVQPAGGKWHVKPRGWMSIQEQGREKGSLPTVWFANIDPHSPAVPVKLRVKTDYGTLFMHLVEYKKGNRLIKSGMR